MGIVDIFGSDDDIDFAKNPIQEAIREDIKTSTDRINSRIDTLNNWTSIDEIEPLDDIPSFQRVLDLDQHFKELYVEVLESEDGEFGDSKRNLGHKIMNARQETQEILDVYTSYLAVSDAEIEFHFDFGGD